MIDARQPPFLVGGPIPTAQAADHLHGFEEERRLLIQYLNKRLPVRLGILGARRSGKTSLLLSVAPQVPAGPVHLDCTRIWPASRPAFYRLLMEALGQPRPDKAPTGTPAEAYPQLPLPKKGPPGILVLENADALDEIDPALLDELPLLAVRLPHHLVLTGSAARLAPLVEFSIPLAPFSEATAADFLRKRFLAKGMTVEEPALNVFHEFTKGRPDALQRLALATWERLSARGATRVRAEDVDAAVSDLVDRLPTESLAGWAAVRGLMRDVFIAMCRYDLSSPTEIANRIGVEPKNVVVLLSRLVAPHGLVVRSARGEYRVEDPLLKHYVRKDWGSPILR